MSKSFSNVVENPRVGGHISEKDELENQVETDQTSPHQAPKYETDFTPPPYIISNQSRDALSHVSLTNKEHRLNDAVIASDAFMPPQLDSEIIPYIDSSFSDSDGYQTPPESPATGYRSCDAAPLDDGDYQAPAEMNVPEASSIFAKHRFGISDGLEHVTDTLHTARYNSEEEKHPDSEHASPEYSTPEANVLDSISLVPKVKPAESVNTHTDHSTHDADMHLNGVSVERNDLSLFNSDFWKTSKSEISADFDVKTQTTDNTPKADTIDNSISSIPQPSTSFTSSSFTYPNNTLSSTSDFVFPPEPYHSSPGCIITTEIKGCQTSTTDNTEASITEPVKNIDPYYSTNVPNDTSKPISVLDVISDTDTKPDSSFPNSNAVYKDAYDSLVCFLTTTVNDPPTLSHLDDSRPDFTSETISMESPQTKYTPARAVDSEEPCLAVAPVHTEPVLPDDESVKSGIHTTNSTKTHTFDLSGPSDPITSDPDHSWRAPSDNASYSSAASQNGRQDCISRGMDRAKSASFENLSSSSSRAFMPTISPSHSLELLNSMARKEEVYRRTIKAYEGLNTEDMLYKGSLKNYEKTTRNDLQMSVKEGVSNDTEMKSEQSVKRIYILPQKHEKAQKTLSKILGKHEGAEEMPGSLQNTKGVLALESEVCVDAEVLTGQAERQIHRFAPLKPALPVDRECVAKECDPAPPSAEPVEVSLADSSMATHNHLETWLHPRHSSGEKTLPEDTARIRYQTSAEILHAEVNGEVTLFSEGRGWRSAPDTEIPANTETFIHSKYASHSQGEVKTDADNIRTFTHGSVVDISETTPEGRSDAEVQEHLLPTRLTQGDR